jgi:outer membrane protein assembly factor BamB
MFVSRFGVVLVSLTLLLGRNPDAIAWDWPQFRGPEGQGHANARKLPTEWSTTKNVVWSQEIPGAGWSSPVIQNGKVFLTTAVQPSGGGNVTLRAICLNAADGKTIWNTELFSIAPVSGGHKKNSHASPTPLAEDGKLYVHFGSYGTAALDLNGKVLWRNTLKYSPVHGNGGSPILVGDALIMSCDGSKDPFVVALKKQTGEVLWKTPRQGNAKKTFSFSTPLAIEVNGKTQVVSPTSGGVMAYNPRDGKEIWRVNYAEGYSVVPRPVFGHGMVFVSSAFDRPVVYAIDPKGTGDITDSAVKWTMTKGAPNTPSPLLVGDEIYFVSDNGIMTCADAKSGAVHWQERLDGKSSANYSASPVFADGKIFVQNEEGVGTVVKPGKAFEALARNDLKERSLASYAVDDGALYIRTAQKLYRIGESK